MTSTSWGNWLEPVQILSGNQYEIILEVPNFFVQEYIISNYGNLLKDVMKSNDQHEIQIKFEIRPPVQKTKEKFTPESNEVLFSRTLLKKYQQAIFENSRYLTEHLIQYGKEWALNPLSLIITGGLGCGKTYYCCCLIREAMRSGCISEATYLSSTELDSKLLQAIKSDHGDYKLLQEYKNTELLFIDDFGRETKSERMFRQLYEIINYRYGNEKTTLISTNLSIAEISDTICPAIASRMCEWEIIEMKGQDLRRII